jgi:hypothetical protein
LITRLCFFCFCRIVFIVHNIIQTSSEATVIGAAFDGIEDTNPWTDSVSLSLLTFPTPDAELNLSHLFAMGDVVWMGDAERLEMSRSAETLDNSAAERLEMSALCIDNLAAKLEHLEMSLSFEVLENSVAMRLEMSGPGSGTIDNSAAWQLAAGSAPTLVVSDKVAETANGSDGCVVQILVAGVDVGPGEMKGAHAVNNCGQKFNENYSTMGDWNDLLNAEDQLGLLPSWNSSGSAVNEITLPVMECGNSLMTDILESMDQRESEG